MSLLALVREIHKSGGPRFAIAATGGGASAIGMLVSVPGCSNTLLEGTVPYARGSFINYCDAEPASFCSDEAALDLARAAYTRGYAALCRDATSFQDVAGRPTVGIGCTAALRSLSPKHGPHRCHVAVWAPSHATHYRITMTKGARSREEEDTAVSALILYSMAESIGPGVAPAAVTSALADVGLVATPGSWNASGEGPLDHIESRVTVADAAGPLSHLLTDPAAPPVLCLPDGAGSYVPSTCSGVPRGTLLLSGSFNPFHKGHEELLVAAGKTLEARGLTAGPLSFELSVRNADKPPLAREVVDSRIAQFVDAASRLPAAGLSTAVWPLIVSNAPLFVEKASLFPGSYFVVGFDTAVRLVNAKYYGDDPYRLGEALGSIRRAGCKFLVAGRLTAGSFQTFDAMLPLVPPMYADLFLPIPAELFRVDLSSTQLREAK